MTQPDRDPVPDDRFEGGFRIRRNARRGFALGAAVAVVVFVGFVLLPGTARPMIWYVGLAAVLGVSVGLLLTVLLVAWRTRRLVRRA